MGLVYKRMDLRVECYTKGKTLDGSGIQKDGFGKGMVYKRKDVRREWYAKELILDRNGIQKDRF